MSVHIEAKVGEIAETVLLPGDPLRAKYIAEKFLENPVCFNQVRGMLGYTGTYKGKKVSVMGSGMGQASLSIYANELINFYGVKRLIRVGSCGSYQEDIKVREIVLAQSASTDGSLNARAFKGMDFAPCATFKLLAKSFEISESKKIKTHVGNILSTDSFYNPVDAEEWKLWAAHGVMAVEMESNALYTIAAKNGVESLSILTVSDSLVSGVETTSEEREKSFDDMVEIALEVNQVTYSND